MEKKALERYMREVGSVSVFSPQRINREDLKKILTALSRAPSASNAQPWEIIIVESEKGKERVLDCLANHPGKESAAWLLASPLILVVALDTLRAKAKTGPSGVERFGLVDLGAACQNLLLAALSLGIKGTVVREIDGSRLGQGLGVPSHVEPLFLVGMGYSSEEPVKRPVLRLDDFVHYETWDRMMDTD